MIQFAGNEVLKLIDPSSRFYGLILRAQKFHLGDWQAIDTLEDLSHREFFRAPFPVCLFQVHSEESVHLFLTEDDGSTLLIHCFYKNEGSSMRWDHADMVLRISEGVCAFESRHGETSSSHDITERVLSEEKSLNFGSTLMSMALVLEVFSCTNVGSVVHEPPKFINAKRIAKGRTPIFSYRTITITGGESGEREESAVDGHRGSPRLHLRRGHIRRLSSGRIWVRSSIVGQRSAGFVHKDYAVANSQFGNIGAV